MYSEVAGLNLANFEHMTSMHSRGASSHFYKLPWDDSWDLFLQSSQALPHKGEVDDLKCSFRLIAKSKRRAITRERSRDVLLIDR